jgi:hypothetical protein
MLLVCPGSNHPLEQPAMLLVCPGSNHPLEQPAMLLVYAQVAHFNGCTSRSFTGLAVKGSGREATNRNNQLYLRAQGRISTAALP